MISKIYRTAPKGSHEICGLYDQTRKLIALNSDNSHIKSLIHANIDKMKELRIVYDYKVEW